MKRICAALALVAVTGGVGPARASSGSFTEHVFTVGAASRHYWLYVPAGAHEAPMPLVVFLHGCTQRAVGASRSTKFNELADARAFVVAYPEQNFTAPSTAPLADGNGEGCWNWFLPDDQARDAGEPALIAGITREVIAGGGIDTTRVFVDGISAGADMAVIMGVSYPDLFAAVAVIAGCGYKTCADVSGSLAYQQMGPRARVVPVFVEQGTADMLNVFPLGVTAVSQWLGTNDFADDGSANRSVARTPATVTNFGFDQTRSRDRATSAFGA